MHLYLIIITPGHQIRVRSETQSSNWHKVRVKTELSLVQRVQKCWSGACRR